MTILDRHWLCSLLTRMSLLRSSLYSANIFKMKKNGVVERKNKSLQEMARTMLNDVNSLKYLWVEVVNVVCYLQNIIYIRPIFKKTLCELRKDNLGKFDPNYDKGTYIRYSTMSKAYRVYNSRTLKVEESIHRQGTITLSTTEVEYISIAQCYSQLLWIKHQLEDYDIIESNIPLLYDNTTAINLSKNPILHSCAKQIEIKHISLGIMFRKRL
ncbi:Copia protein, partial [Mucuna pruriens]